MHPVVTHPSVSRAPGAGSQPAGTGVRPSSLRAAGSPCPHLSPATTAQSRLFRRPSALLGQASPTSTAVLTRDGLARAGTVRVARTLQHRHAVTASAAKPPPGPLHGTAARHRISLNLTRTESHSHSRFLKSYCVCESRTSSRTGSRAVWTDTAPPALSLAPRPRLLFPAHWSHPSLSPDTASDLFQSTGQRRRNTETVC